MLALSYLSSREIQTWQEAGYLLKQTKRKPNKHKSGTREMAQGLRVFVYLSSKVPEFGFHHPS